MSNAVVTASPYQFKLTVTAGPHKGDVITLVKPYLSIGRDNENDFVFAKDTQISRKHVEIKVDNYKVYLTNLSSKNPVYVNNEEVSIIELLPVNNIIIGETEFRLEVFSLLQAQPQKPLVKPQGQSTAPPAFKSPPPIPSHKSKIRPPPQFVSQTSQSQGTGKFTFYLIILVCAAGLIWLLTSEDQVRGRKVKLRTQDQVTQEIIASEGQTKSLERQIEETGQNTIQYKTAQEHYLKGFRDYRNGQYSRAISSFQAALSFYPQHDLARKYYTLSKRKFDEQVQFKMIQGKRYRGKNNYRLCKSSYAAVMIMLKDQNDPVYKEARQFYNECSLQLEGMY